MASINRNGDTLTLCIDRFYFRCSCLTIGHSHQFSYIRLFFMANIYNNFGKNIRILRTSIDRYATQKSFRRLIAKIDRENEIICYIY